MPYPSLLHPEPLPLWQSTADPYLHRRHSNTVLSQSLWGPWALVCTRFVWALLASLVGMEFDFKHEFAPPTILLRLLLCPWVWGISPQLLQHLLSLTMDVGYLLKAGPAKHSHHPWRWSGVISSWPLTAPVLHSRPKSSSREQISLGQRLLL